MKKVSLKSLKNKRYVAGVLIIVLMIGLLGLFKVANIDRLKGTIKINNAHLVNVSTKLNANIYDLTEDNNVESNGFDQVDYTIKYSLSESNENRDVLITATLPDTEQYATFKKTTGSNVTSVLSNGGKQIDITISNVESGQEITSVVSMLVSGAPNNYTITPNIKIKESTSDTYTDIVTRTVTVKTNSLTGIVRDYDNNPVENILVGLYKNGTQIKETYTDEYGRYTFSDIAQGEYSVEINEDIYDKVEQSNVNIAGNTSLNLLVNRVYPFEIKTHKYITKVDLNNNGIPSSHSYNDLSLVQIPVENLGLLKGRVYYKIVVENTGEKEGIVSLVKDELPEFMSFDESLNSGFELKNGYIYDRNLEGITLSPGEKKTDVLVLNIEDTKEAKRYLNRVTAYGEIYDHVTYLLDGDVYKEEDVLEGETITEAITGIDGFKGWFTDEKFTNKYKFTNPVIKDLILYGQTNEKYNVEFYDKDPENGDEDLYHEEEVNSGDTVDEPTPDPIHTGYTFEHWCTEDLEEYDFTTPVTSNLKLITCYKINEYDVNFYNYEDTKEKTIKVEYKHTIDQTEAPTFDETGYTFTCWTDNKQTKECFDFTTPITKEVNLYPQHEIIENAVIFNDENRITTVNVEYAQTVDPIADQGKEGHTFSCWSEDRENCFDFTTPIIKTTTVYAIYDINKFTVSFFDKDPETEIETQYSDVQTINYKGKATKPTPDPTHTGYTFNSWIKEDGTTYDFNTEVTENIRLISKYDINSYPVRFHDGDTVTEKNVVYKNLVTPIEDPTKEHNIFLGWTKDNELFNFNTPIVEETDLYSSYEEVKTPTVSHTPTMWTNGNVTLSIDKNSELSNDDGYSYQYKLLDDENYSNYNSENKPTIESNTTIIAKSTKSNVDSEIVNHIIENIDKIDPIINGFAEGSTGETSTQLNVDIIDGQSGINYYEVYQDNTKVGEKRFECYDQTSFSEYESCRSNYSNRKTDTYTITGLTAGTTYTFKIKVYDKAGNYIESDELEITPERNIVARLIGYNNQLFTDTLGDNNEIITPKEDKYINFSSLAEAFAYGTNSGDLYDCQTVQCTIQMVKSTNESVTVLDTQNLTLDLNDKVVSGVSQDYTIYNNGIFQLVDNSPIADENGKLINNNGIALYNKAGATLIMGDGSSEPGSTSLVSITKPFVYSTSYGIYNEASGQLKFFDGKVMKPYNATVPAVFGEVTETEYSYNASVTNPTMDNQMYEVVSLNQLVDPEARRNNSYYYSKLATALDVAEKGPVVEEPIEGNLLETTANKSNGSFVYDEETNKVSSTNNEPATTANTDLIIDTKVYDKDKLLTIDYSLNPSSDGSVGTMDIKVYKLDNHGIEPNSQNTWEATFTTTYNNDNKDVTKVYKLKPGAEYRVVIKYTQPTIAISEEDPVTLGNVVINDMTMGDYNSTEYQTTHTEDINLKTEGFRYDPEMDVIISNNQYEKPYSIATSYLEIDLTDKTGDYEITVSASMESFSSSYAYGSIEVNDSMKWDYYYPYGTSGDFLHFEKQSYDPYVNTDTPDKMALNGYFFYNTGTVTNSKTLEGGKKYYLLMRYFKSSTSYYPTEEEFREHNNLDALIIHKINVYKKNSNVKDLKPHDFVELDSILSDLATNSNDQFTVESDNTIKANVSFPSQNVRTNYSFDLTNETYTDKKMLNFEYEIIPDSEGSKGNLGTSIYAYRTVDGVEEKKYIGCNYRSNGNNYESSCFIVPGYRYEVSLNYSAPSTSNPETYGTVNIKKAYFAGFKGIKGTSFTGVSYEDNVINVVNNVPENGKIVDSYIKIDLSDATSDQLLSYSGRIRPYYSLSYMYLTKNNKGLSKTALDDNNRDMLFYNDKQEYVYRDGNSLYYMYNPYSFYLEKGNIYYLHFANYLFYTTWYSSYGDYSFTLRDLKLTPIDESVVDIGSHTIFTGTEDLSPDEEETSTVTLDNAKTEVNFVSDNYYDFIYNEETDTYVANNKGIKQSVASTILKFDLTDSATDRSFIFNTNGKSYSSYKIGINEKPTPVETQWLISGYTSDPARMEYLDNGSKFTLPKGNIYYVQVCYANQNGNEDTLEFSLDEYFIDNQVDIYNEFNEVSRFNEEVDRVQLLKDINVTEPVTTDYSQDVVLDLNGYKLTSNTGTVIENNGSLLLTDSKANDSIKTYNDGLSQVYNYSNTGYSTFTAPVAGIYNVELWGASGGYAYSAENRGGAGGYASGDIFLKQGERIYITVGGKGADGTEYNKKYSGGYNGGGGAKSDGRSIWGSGGGATAITKEYNYQMSTLNSSYTWYETQFLMIAGGGGGAGMFADENGTPIYQNAGGAGGGTTGYAGKAATSNKAEGGTQTDPGLGNNGNRNYRIGKHGVGGGTNTQDGGGGGAGWYGGGGGYDFGAGSGGGSSYYAPAYISNFKTNYNYDNNGFEEPTSNNGKIGNGYARITLKSQKGTINNKILNKTKAELILDNVYIEATTGIENHGTLRLVNNTIIKVTSTNGTGIENYSSAKMLDSDGSARILIHTDCVEKSQNAIGIRFKNGSEVSVGNLTIAGNTGIGIYNEQGANTVITNGSRIQINDVCDSNNETFNLAKYDDSATSEYSKNVNFKYKYYVGSWSSRYDRIDATVLNYGDLTISSGTDTDGLIRNESGNLNLINGINFDKILEKDGTIFIDNSGFTIKDEILVENGTLNIGTNTSSFGFSTNKDFFVYNFGTLNTTGGYLQKVYNAGTFNSTGTSLNKVYNVYTCVNFKMYDHEDYYSGYTADNPPHTNVCTTYRGTTNINSNGIYGETVVNEGQFNFNGGTITQPIINRGDLYISSNANIFSNSNGIINKPMSTKYKVEYENGKTEKVKVHNRSTLTLGENDETVKTSPTIQGSGGFSVTGDCYSNGGYFLDRDEFTISADTRATSHSINEFTKMSNYMKDHTLCNFDYYDGNLANSKPSTINDVVDIPIDNAPDNHDLLFTTSVSGDYVSNSIVLRELNDEYMPAAYSYNGNSYKSLDEVLAAIPDNTLTTVDVVGSKPSVHKVTIPENKQISLNYTTDSITYSYSKNPLITNNGTLEYTGVGTNNVIGLVNVENNGTFNVNGLTNNNKTNYSYKQSSLVKNNGTTTINTTTMNDLDIKNTSTLNIVDGNYTASTIYSDGGNISINGGYFAGEENSNYSNTIRQIKTSGGLEEVTINTKPLLDVNSTNVTISGLDNTADSRYENITFEQRLGYLRNNSTLTLENNKLGGKTTASDGLFLESVNSTINVNSGTYDNISLLIDGNPILQEGSELTSEDLSAFNLNGGIITGSQNNPTIVMTGVGTTAKFLDGEVINNNKSAVEIIDSSLNKVIMGTKGDRDENDNLIVSKTSPKIAGSGFGMASSGSHLEQAAVYFYDGLFEASGSSSNPLDVYVEDTEEGYSVIYDRTDPSKKYLDILPIIYNLTQNRGSMTFQEGFDLANEGDELVITRDYVNKVGDPTITIAEGKKFTLYFDSQMKTVTNDGVTTRTFKKYEGTVEDGYTVQNPIITFNNKDEKDSFGDIVTYNPFIENNGDVKFVGSLSDVLIENNTTSGTPEFNSNSGGTAVKNNEGATITLDKITMFSTSSSGTMFRNAGTMNVIRGMFVTLQDTVFDNSGTLNIIGEDGQDTDSCYIPTNIYISYLDGIKDTLVDPHFRYYSKEYNDNLYKSYHTRPTTETIINTGTANINYLNVNHNYGYSIVHNLGTMNINNSSFSQINNNLGRYPTILNTGTINTDNLIIKWAEPETYQDMQSSYDSYETPIRNYGTMKFENSYIDSVYSLGILNSSYTSNEDPYIPIIYRGNLTVKNSTIKNGRTGIASENADTSVIDSTLNNKYYSIYSNNGNLTIDGSTISSTGGNNVTQSYTMERKDVITGCSNGTPTLDTSTHSYSLQNYDRDYNYYSTPVIYVASGNSTIKDSTINLTSSGINKNPNKVYDLDNITPLAIGVIRNSGNMDIIDSTINMPSGYKNNYYQWQGVETWGRRNSVNGNYVYIQSTTNIINSSAVSTVTEKNGITNVGKKDGVVNPDSPNLVASYCRDNAEMNMYDGYTTIKKGAYICNFTEIEDNYNLIGEGYNRTLSQDNIIYNKTKDRNYNSLTTAFSEAANNDELEILKSISIPGNHIVQIDGKEISIDLKGYNITGTLELINSSNLTVKDSTYDETGTDAVTSYVDKIINNDGVVSIEQGEIQSIENNSIINTSGTIKGTIVNNLTSNAGQVNVSGGKLGVVNINNSSSITQTGGEITYIHANNNAAVNILNSGTKANYVHLNDTSSLNLVDATISSIYNRSTTPLTLNSGVISYSIVNYSVGNITINDILNYDDRYYRETKNSGTMTINGGRFARVQNNGGGTITINGGTIGNIYNDPVWDCSSSSHWNGVCAYDEEFNSDYRVTTAVDTITINDGNISNIQNNDILYIRGGNIGSIKVWDADLEAYRAGNIETIIGTKDGSVDNTSPTINNPNGTALTIYRGNSNNIKTYYYDGTITGKTSSGAIQGIITELETGMELKTKRNFDPETGQLDGTETVSLGLPSIEDSQVAYTNGKYYDTLQLAINASYNEYDSTTGYPDVRLNLNVELDEDLTLPGELETGHVIKIYFGEHIFNANGHTIPEGIELYNSANNRVDINGDLIVDGSLSRFLADILNINNTTKSIIVYQMEDGSRLDSSKTYKLYVYDNNIYKPLSVAQDEEAGKYKVSKENETIRPIKGRVYFNDLSAGEYKLVDNAGREVDFAINDNGTISSNIKEYIRTDYGRIIASSVAELVITIQTGITRANYIAIALSIIIGIIILFIVSRKNKSIKKEETI